MTGRLAKLRRRRDAPPSDSESAANAPESSTPEPPVEPPTATLFADANVNVDVPTPLPADVAPDLPTQHGFRDRSRFRRRLRYLRRVRELGFRDLGGLVFDLHRFQRPGDDLIAGKLTALAAVDRELRALERAMQDERDFADLREPGVAACARCGALHGSDARFCPSCGISLGGPRTLSELPVVATAQPSPPVAVPVTPAAWDSSAGPPSSQSAAPQRTDEAPTQALPVVSPSTAPPADSTAPPVDGS